MARQFYSFAALNPWPAEGVNDKWLIETQSVAKTGSSADDDHPFLIANEWIAANIAWFLRLPVPPFAIVRRDDRSRSYFASLHFGTDVAPGDADPDECIAANLDLCSGVLLFDILIANSDRHEGNLKVDRRISPKVFHVFDHDRCLLGCMPGDELKRISDLWDRLGMSGASVSGGNVHFLLRSIKSTDFFWKWIKRIEAIPSWFIREICGDMCGIGSYSRRHSSTVAEFLIHRKYNLERIVKAHKAEFTGIENWGLLW